MSEFNTSLYQAADEFFAVHPEADFWLNLSVDRRRGALRAAWLDIVGLTPGGDPDCDGRELVKAALFEQAAFVARRHPEPPTRRRELVQESVDGLGSRKWQLASADRSGEFAPRALALLRAAYPPTGAISR